MECEIEAVVDFGIIGKMVDGRRDDSVAKRQDGGDGLDGAGGSQEMAGHRFGGTDAQLVCMVPEYAQDGFGLGNVAQGVEVPCTLI